MTEKLNEAAKKFIKSRLWEQIDEDDVFAVKLSDGETGYVSVIGSEKNGGQGLPETGCVSLELYRGDTEIESLLDTHVYLDVYDKSEFAGIEKYFARNCLISAINEEGEPRFLKASSFRGRQEITDEVEKFILCEALLAAASIGEEGWKGADESSEEFDEDAIIVPLYTEKDGEYAFEKYISLPEPCTTLEPDVDVPNETLEELLAIPRDGSWECEMIFVPEAKKETESQAVYYDHMTMLVNNSTGASLVTEPFRGYQKTPEKAGEAFVKLLQLRKVRPEAIIARDDRTFELLENVCESLEIDISQTEDLPILDAVQTALLHQDKEAQKKAEEEFEKFIDGLCEMPDETFEQLPKQLLDEVRVLLEMGVITGEKAEKIKNRL